MKKNFLLILTIMLACVATAWGQHQEYTVDYTVNHVVYNGSNQTGVVVNDDNCSSGESISGNTGTNAGTYTATISSNCTGHTYPLVYGSITIWHTASVNVAWTILPRPLTDSNVAIETQDLEWTGAELAIAGAVKSIKYNGTDLTLNTDYTLYVVNGSSPGKVRDEGRYTLVFEGIGNFNAIVTKTFDVKKNLAKTEAETGLHYAIADQVFKWNKSTEHYDPLAKFDMEVTDTKSHTILYEGETKDYTLKFFDTEAKADAWVTASTDAEKTEALANATPFGSCSDVNTDYYVVIEGVAPKYSGKVKKLFHVVTEYQTIPAAEVDGQATPEVCYRITKPSYPHFAPVGATAPVRGEVVATRQFVSAGTYGPCAIASGTDPVNRCVIESELAITHPDGTEYYNVVGIDDNAFTGLDQLRWIDINIPAEVWTPSSLDRTVANTPFYGVPKQTLVYLNGTTVTGVNYIYKFVADDYRCAQYKIFEDKSGTQTQFE